MDINIDRKTFVKEKLNNFILYITEVFGENNVLLNEFKDYINVDVSYEPFIKGILELCQLLHLPMNTEEKKQNNIVKFRTYLDYKQLKAHDEEIYKILRYFELFYKVF